MPSLDSLKPLIEFVRGMVPDKVKDAVNYALDLVASAMQGEPVLVVGNGAAVVIYLVAKAFNSIPDLTFEDSVKAAAAAIITLNTALLAIRSIAYSPKSVAAIVTAPPTAAGPVDAAIAAGVPVQAVQDAADAQPVDDTVGQG